MIYKFYDTSSLLINPKVNDDEVLVISSITLQELEKIKTSVSKDIDTKRAPASSDLSRKTLRAMKSFFLGTT